MQRSRFGELKKLIEDPPRELVDETCRRCPLFPSKASQQDVPQTVLAAAERGSTLKRLIDTKVAQIIFKPDDISAKRYTAMVAYLQAEARSDKNRFPKNEDKKPKIPKDVGYID